MERVNLGKKEEIRSSVFMTKISRRPPPDKTDIELKVPKDEEIKREVEDVASPSNGEVPPPNTEVPPPNREQGSREREKHKSLKVMTLNIKSMTL